MLRKLTLLLQHHGHEMRWHARREHARRHRWTASHHLRRHRLHTLLSLSHHLSFYLLSSELSRSGALRLLLLLLRKTSRSHIRLYLLHRLCNSLRLRLLSLLWLGRRVLRLLLRSWRLLLLLRSSTAWQRPKVVKGTGEHRVFWLASSRLLILRACSTSKIKVFAYIAARTKGR